jgi:hypothetical protein
MHWLQHFFGYQAGGGNGAYYLFFSGIGSIILPPVLTLAGIVAVFGWRHQCHERRCLRVARFTAGEYRVCRKHHPEGAPDSKTIAERYHLYLGDRPGKG